MNALSCGRLLWVVSQTTLRLTPSGFIDRFGLPENLVAEILAESLRGEQVHRSTESFGKLVLDLDELEQADFTMSSVYNLHRRFVNSGHRMD
jgi:hypothetical protein